MLLARQDAWDHLMTFVINLPALLAALAAFIQSLRNASKAEEIKAGTDSTNAQLIEARARVADVKAKVDETAAKVDAAKVKVEEIHAAVEQTKATVDKL